jgi:hypothetical protein
MIYLQLSEVNVCRFLKRIHRSSYLCLVLRLLLLTHYVDQCQAKDRGHLQELRRHFMDLVPGQSVVYGEPVVCLNIFKVLLQQNL